jgi:hypothetical protein
MQPLPNDFFHILVVGLQKPNFLAERKVLRIQAGYFVLQGFMARLQFPVFQNSG